MIDEDVWMMLDRYLANQCTDVERESFERWLDEVPGRREFVEGLRNTIERASAPSDSDSEPPPRKALVWAALRWELWRKLPKERLQVAKDRRALGDG